MPNKLYTFINIFNYESGEGEGIIRLNKIIIPIIQRDYAQGRLVPEINRVRERFLSSLYDAVEEKPITLDFIYGDIDNNGIMIPLDGQQRLTTLFLLHWYAAKKERVEKNKYIFLTMFSYETRYSARDFCKLLVDFTPSFSSETKISDEIKNQFWFPLSWEKDQTVSSMLVMIDAINEKFNKVENLWDKLEQGRISFYFLPIKDMGLTDELYIKMNSRGKPLTKFEHFKAEFEREVKNINEDLQKRISLKIDNDWTNLLWNYRSSDNLIDNGFLRYFRFICDVICYKKGDIPQEQSQDEFDLIGTYFKGSQENVELLESYFDCWVNIKEKTPSDLFLAMNQENVFKECLENFTDLMGNKSKKFTYSMKFNLYATIIFLLNRDKISDEQFIRRMRILDNLNKNSLDDIRERLTSEGINRMTFALRQIDSIILQGIINSSIKNNFNDFQLKEEAEKIEWLKNNPSDREKIYELEDHELLYGQISIIGLDNIELAPRFISLFNCDLDKISCALLATGDYSQKDRRRRQLGSTMPISWERLFHKSGNGNYDDTKKVLNELLKENITFTDDILADKANRYINKCEEVSEYPWQYYYIKYPIFRPENYGKYTWEGEEFENKPYEFFAMHTATNHSQNSYQPFLKEIDSSRINRDDLGRSLLYNNTIKVTCLNDSYQIENILTNAVETIDILQNSDGIDNENRIEIGKREIPLLVENLLTETDN